MKASGRMSYKQKLLAFSLLMGIVPVLIMGAVSLKLFSNTLQEEVDLHQQSILRHFQTQLDTYINRLDQMSVSLATNTVVQRTVETGLSMGSLEGSIQFINETQNFVTNSDIPINVTVIMMPYNSVYSSQTGLIRQIDYPYSEVLKLQWTGSNTSYKITPNTYQGQSNLLVIRPVPLNSSSPKAILVMELNMDKLMDTVERTLYPLNQELLVFDDLGRMAARGRAWSDDEIAEMNGALGPFLSKTKALPPRIDIAGSPYLLTSLKSTWNGWTYVAVSSVYDLSAKSDNIKRVSWLLILGICLVWGTVAFFGSKKLITPLQRLAANFSNKDESDVISALDRTMQDMKQSNERLTLRLNEQMPVLKEHALLNLIRGEMSSDNAVGAAWKTYVEPLQGNWFCVGVAEIDQMLEMKQTYRDNDLLLIMYALRKLIEEIGEGYRPVLGVSTKQGQVAFVMGLDSPGEEADELLRGFAASINEQVKLFFSYTVSVAMAEPREGFEQIHLSYKEAQSLMVYRLAMGPETLLLPEQTRDAMPPSLRSLIRLERKVVAGIVQGHYEEASAGVKELIQEALKSLHSTEAIVGLFVHLIGELETSFQEYGHELDDVVGAEALRHLYGLSHPEQLQTWMDRMVIEPVKRQIVEMQVPKRKKTVQAALALVQEQIEQDVSLQLIADELQTPRPTLSKWFKEETGEDFRDHLIRVRMEKAKEWLLHGDMPIKEISDRLRYTSVPNFTRIFKQSTGMAPGAFRSKNRGESGPHDQDEYGNV